MRRARMVVPAVALVLGACGPAAGAPPPPDACGGVGMGEHRYVTSVGPDGRYFQDQDGAPVLVLGDSPWAGLSRWSPDEAQRYFARREAAGFNASIVSLVGARNNGGPDDEGATFDGIRPFVDGDVTRWHEPYWERVDDYVRSACDHGNTLFLYPIDGWNVGNAFRNATPDTARRYGAMVAERFARFPNIVWMTGGDHFPSDPPGRADTMFRHVLDGIRSTGDARPFSIQLGYPVSLSSDSPVWAPHADFEFVYTYLPTYRAVLDGYARSTRPALLSEANYEGENNLPGTPVTTDVVLRRQMAWALTSGSPGYFYGSDDWELLPGWESRLDTPAVEQLRRMRDLFATLDWPTLRPDETAEVLVAGRGAPVADGEEVGVLANDHVTAARVGADTLVAYVPTARTLTVDRAALAEPTARWVDASDATAPPVETAVDPAGTITTPGPNAAGGEDWLLLLTLR